MTATAIAPSDPSAPSALSAVGADSSAPSWWPHGARLALVALAVVVLLAAAFVIGRATATSAHVVTTVVHTPIVTPTTTFCRLGRAC